MAKVGFSVCHTSGRESRFSKMKVASTCSLSLPTVYETAVTFTDGSVEPLAAEMSSFGARAPVQHKHVTTEHAQQDPDEQQPGPELPGTIDPPARPQASKCKPGRSYEGTYQAYPEQCERNKAARVLVFLAEVLAAQAIDSHQPEHHQEQNQRLRANRIGIGD